MTFWDHVEELRRRVIVSCIFVLAGSVAGYFIFPELIKVLVSLAGDELYAFEIAEGFMVRMKIALTTGLFLSLPVIIFEIAVFIKPALMPREKIIMICLLTGTFLLFTGGVIFAFQAVLPYSIQFLKSNEFFPDKVGLLVSLDEFIDFFMTFLIGFGLCFQFPIVMLLFLKFRIVPFSFFVKNFRYMIIFIFVVAAIITPPDVISQIAVALPMLALYGISLLAAKLLGLGLDERKGD